LDERVGMIEALVRGQDERVEGSVRIAMNEHVSAGFLLERLVRVRELHPGLELEVTTSNHRVNLLRREADIAIRVAPAALPEQQELVVRKLGSLALALYATRAYLAAHPAIDLASGLAGHEVIFYEQELASAPPGQWLAKNATQARPVLRLNSLLGAAIAAAAGAGLALLPTFLAAAHAGLVRALDEDLASSDVWLLVHPELAETARVRAVVTHIVEVFTIGV
jgi:DNA-binding transcriptional LysR family regulator